MRIISELKSADGTIKRAHILGDGSIIESALIPHRTKTNLCISSQVGCRMGCAFCESGKRFARSLTAEEIVGQIDQPVDSVVLMGMGEPLDNPDILEAIERIKKEKGIPSRKIVVSTCGICDRLESLLPTRANIAISINATTDEQRDSIMPINKRFPLESLKKAMQSVSAKLPSRRRLQIEYVLIKDFNDSVQDAERLAALAPGKSLINLIPVNSIKFKAPEKEAIASFKSEMRRHGFICYIREPRGKDINAACGMLAGKSPLDSPAQNI